ncbi:Sensor kinase CusS [Anaerohalosphaera lusitana]|uniref:histidine kinase n=1 Tax=Anaerohalosphaera lusitana TaxID=1936003 RepID=A0A1U9NMM6_9BACT|nr:HAMP domain-containing sensor histidine kinase [Anaerohalosphaera lusitana]AQT68850.1 Sensor kinase CusS [Anaerohalosphaera lusitana]
MAQKKNLEFKINYNSGYREVEAVPDQIGIVLRCLLENAAKYSFNGKPNDKRKISVRFNNVYLGEKRALEISIQNYGCPISLEEASSRRIFQLGYRGEYSGEGGRQGTGTGLYLVDRITTAHKGRIDVHSKPDGPAENNQAVNTFVLTWPRYFQE